MVQKNCRQTHTRIKGTVQLREIHIKGIKLSFACSVHIGILHFEHLPTLWADESAQTGSEDWNRKWVGKERGVRFRCIRPPTHLSPGHTEDIIVLPKIYEGGGSGNSFAARHSFYLPPSPLPVTGCIWKECEPYCVEGGRGTTKKFANYVMYSRERKEDGSGRLG